MEISRKTDYALLMIAELVRQPECILSVRAVAEAKGIPYSFARAIQHDLTRAGVVESVRGAHGGMKLSVDPTLTSLLDIIEIVQGKIAFSDYENEPDGSDISTFTPIWANATRIMRAYFASVTLEDAVINGRIPVPVTDFPLTPSAG